MYIFFSLIYLHNTINNLNGFENMKRIDVDLASVLQAFEAKHFTRAMQLLSPLAEEGNLEAQHRCAIMYQNGLGNNCLLYTSPSPRD